MRHIELAQLPRSTSRRKGSAAIGVFAIVGLVLAVHGHSVGETPTTTDKVRLEGAGATFPALLYKKWIALYTAQNPQIVIDYKDVGSGEGVKRFLARSVDFGASDGALTDEQIAAVAGGARLVPVTAGMVVLAYNVLGLGGELKLSRDVYVDIFLHKIVKWNDARIQAINPDLRLPNRNIALAARQDGSGTTFALSNHLSAISTEWRDAVGTGYVVDWAGRAMRGRGNEGVAALIKLGEGSIGYVEYAFALRLGLPMARLQNKAGRYVAPTDRTAQQPWQITSRRCPRIFASSFPIQRVRSRIQSCRSAGCCCTRTTKIGRRASLSKISSDGASREASRTALSSGM